MLREQVIAALDGLKARDIREIDVRGKTSIADMLIIASGTSTRHVKSLADQVVKFVKKAGMMPALFAGFPIPRRSIPCHRRNAQVGHLGKSGRFGIVAAMVPRR